MVDIFIIRPGSTVFDDAGRIKGCLDIPLSPKGAEQAEQLSVALQFVKLDCLYVAPGASAESTAERIADRNFCRQKTLDCLANLDHGLWQGKLLAEVKRCQPSFYRSFQENPIEVAPPGGESVGEAMARIQKSLDKIVQKHEDGRIGILVPDPMASIVQYCLIGGRFFDIWKSQCDGGTFEHIQLLTEESFVEAKIETA